MFKIGDFSKLTFVSIKTLRYYDELGLLRPVKVDETSGYRYYTAEQLPRLNRILALKDLGLALEEVKTILDEELPAEQIRGMLRLKKVEVEGRLEEERARLARVEARLRQIEMEGKMPMYDVIIKKLPAQKAASVRRILPNYGEINTLFPELFGQIMGKVRFLGPPMGIYHDHEFREKDVDVELAIPIEGEVPAGGSAKSRELAAIDAACLVYKGSYEQIGEAYNTAMSWLEPNGYRIAGPVREVYLTDPSQVNDPAQNVTEIQLPVEKAV